MKVKSFNEKSSESMDNLRKLYNDGKIPQHLMEHIEETTKMVDEFCSRKEQTSTK